MVAFLITQNQTRGKRSITSIKQMQRVQFSIIKCYFYTKYEIYPRGYTSYHVCFIHFHCMLKTKVINTSI